MAKPYTGDAATCHSFIHLFMVLEFEIDVDRNVGEMRNYELIWSGLNSIVMCNVCIRFIVYSPF